MFLLIALSSLVLPYLGWSVVRFVRNYREAKKMGLPILICPVNPASPLWLCCKDFLTPTLRRLPWGLGAWAGRAEVGWTFFEKYSIHAKHGEVFVIVSPGENEVLVAEPGAADEAMRRRNDFIKNPAMYGMLDIYGPNLDTVNGKAWDRHRKITVPPFNEHNSALVWRETGEQADQMLQVWSQQAPVTSTQSDVLTLALNVLCGAGFGLQSSFVDATVPGGDMAAPGQLGYRESLRVLLANIVPLVFLGIMKRAGLPDWVFRGPLHKLHVAYTEFKGYMGEILAREKAAYEQGDVARHNLMSALVRASEQSNEAARKATNPSEPPIAGLSDDEVYGNVFIYNLAGHDTTAATLHFAIVLLAIHPELQTWIGEEIDQVQKDNSSATLFYEESFPKLERCLALMYETLRLYGPVVMMPRYTADAAQKLAIRDKEYIVPPHTTVTINFAALHTHPKYWAPDPLSFRPGRWTEPPKQGNTEGPGLQPVLGSFVPWNLGPRICPGKKFSQVEFTRVIFSLFANGTRVELAREVGETDTDAQTRAMRIVDEARIEITLKIVGAERIGLRWLKKS